MAVRVEADRDLCIGAGQCLVASSVFELDQDGKVSVLNDGRVAEDELSVVNDAVALCPVEALAFSEQD